MKYFLTRSFIRQNTALIFCAVICGTAHLLCNLVLLLSTGCYFELLFHAGGSKSRALEWLGIPLPHQLSEFYLLFSITIIIKFLLGFVEKYTTGKAGLHFAAKARADYFQYLLYNTDEVVQKTPARKLVWFSSDLKSIQRFMEKGIIGFTRDMTYFFCCVYLLLCFHILLGLIITAAVPLLWYISKNGHRKLKASVKAGRDGYAGLVSFISRRLHNINGQQTQQKTFQTTRRFSERQAKVIALQNKVLAGKAVIAALIPLILFALFVLLLYIMAAPGMINISSADAIGFILLLLNLFSVIRRMVKIESILLPGRLSLEKMEKLMKNYCMGHENCHFQELNSNKCSKTQKND